ncbi:hypothetical protein ACVWWG_000667 [Bradyrhizobium sp. LB7.2]
MEAILRGRVMLEVPGILADILDDDRLTALPDLMADRGLDLELVTGFQPERKFVTRGTGDPPVLRDAGNGRKSHAGGPADHVQDGRDRRDSADLGYVALEIHCRSASEHSPRGDRHPNQSASLQH